MNGMFPKFGAVFAQLEFFTSRLLSDGVVIFPGFFADEKDGFRLFLTLFAFCHARSPDDVEGLIILQDWDGVSPPDAQVTEPDA